MMNRDEFIQLLKRHEWNNIEFKEAKNAVPRNAYETVSAFANTAGGHLVFGAKKDGICFKVVGVIDVDKVQNEFISTLRSKEKISLIIDVKEYLCDLEEKDILVFYVPEASRTEKPVYLAGKKAFIRKGAADVRCTDEELHRLIIDASTERYDEQTVDFDLQSCFDAESISWYRNTYERRSSNRSYKDRNDIDFLSDMGLVRETPQGMKASRAAILLFGRDSSLRHMMPRPVVDCQCFGTVFGEHISSTRWDDRKVFEFNLIRVWQLLLDWYQQIATMPFKIEPDTMQREDTPPDYLTFREAFVNLLTHQDYADRGRHPEILHFTDRTIFRNPGDAFIPLDNFLEPGVKEVRNPLIVRAFRLIGLVENAGWGLRDVFTDWQKSGNVPPVIHDNKADKTFELVLLKELLLSEEQIIFQSQLGVRLDDDAAKLFAYICRNKEISVAEAMTALDQPIAKSLEKLDYLVTQTLIRVIKPQSHYGLAEHLLSKIPSALADEQSPDTTQETIRPKLDLSEDQRKVIRLCEIPRSISSLMDELGVSCTRRFFRKIVLEPLLLGGLIHQTYPEQPKHPKQAYVLTEAGLRLLELRVAIN